MSDNLMSLNEFNERRAGARRPSDAPRQNGIACPTCGKELLDTHPDQVCASMPPKLNVHCSACGYRGCRML